MANTLVKLTNEELFEQGKYNELYVENERLIQFFVNRYANTNIEREELEGLASIAFAKTLKAYTPAKAKFSTYLGTAIKNEIGMYLRTQNKLVRTVSLDETVSTQDEITLGQTLADTTADTEGSVMDSLATSNIMDIINTKLNSMQKTIVTLKLEGKTQKQIADVLETTQATVSRNESKAHAIISRYISVCIA